MARACACDGKRTLECVNRNTEPDAKERERCRDMNR